MSTLEETTMHPRCRLNPFPPSVPIWHRLAKLSILILEEIITKKKFIFKPCYQNVM